MLVYVGYLLMDSSGVACNHAIIVEGDNAVLC